MADYLSMDANRVRFDIARLLEAYPELEGDEDLRADTLEGETDIDRILTRLFLSWRHDEEQAAGAKAIRDDLKAREDRMKHRAAVKKGMALAILEAANLDKRELPVATMSVRRGSISVVIDDVEQLPQGAFTMVKTAASKADLKKMIEAAPAGQFPGAHLELGDDTLNVRAR